MKFIMEKENILGLLYEFDDVFPHNREKISDYSQWAEKISKYGVAAIVEQAGITAGLAVFYENDFTEGKGYISLIGLKEQFRGSGLGQEFLDDIIAEMTMQKMRSVYLEVDNDNPRAFSFYIKYGFIVEERKDYTKMLKYII